MRILFALISATAAGGCAMQLAQSDGSNLAAESTRAPVATANITSSTGSGEAAGYTMSEGERELDCKKLAGKVQLRILELRSGLKPEEASSLARTIQSANAVFGGSTAGLNVADETARKAAQLQAYNKQLVDKNCPSFDIAKALTSTELVPSVSVPAPQKVTR